MNRWCKHGLLAVAVLLAGLLVWQIAQRCAPSNPFHADPSQPEAVLRPVEDIPDAFMGDAAQSDNPNYVKQLYAEYYQKLRVTIDGEEAASDAAAN